MAKLLGRIARRSDPRTLQLAHFAPKAADLKLPVATNFWTKRTPFPPRVWGNDRYGDCTIAKQANMFRRFERLERRATIEIDDDEVVSKYLAMTAALYGGGDTGAYEEDALNRSRNADTALRDKAGHPLLIDAYLSVDPGDQIAIRRAIALANGHGIAFCINLPAAFQAIEPPDAWDLPAGQPATGDYLPGSWGGHSMWSIDYTAAGIVAEHTWGIKPQIITWRAVAAYVDEIHITIDSVDAWRKKTGPKSLDLDAIVDAVNAVSPTKIKAR
jgi:hypothetical protein